MHPRILIAGIGNIFLGDDAFGVEVVRQLARKNVARERAGGRFRHPRIRSHDGAARGDRPRHSCGRGSRAAASPARSTSSSPSRRRTDEPTPGQSMLDPHSLDPVKVLRLARTMGASSGRVLVVGCEPAIVSTPTRIGTSRLA